MAEQPTPDERRFRALASSSVEHVAEFDARGGLVYASPDPRPGYEAGTLGLDRVHPEDREHINDAFRLVFRGGASQRIPFRVSIPGGGLRWVEATITSFVAENDERHALIVSRDVTDARQMEQNLRETRERFRRVAENAYDMIAEHDAQGRMLYCNDRVWHVLGYAEHERLRSSIQLVHPDDRGRLVEAFQSVRDGRAESCQLVHRVLRADGSWCWVDSSVCSAGHGDERRQLVISRDVTEKVDAERRLRESERRYRELVEKAPMGITVLQDERIVYANAAAAAMCGAPSLEALRGTSMYELLDADAAREVAASVARAQRGERQPDAFDVRVRGLDGRERHLLGVGTFTRYAGRPAFQSIMRDVTELEQSRQDQERLALQLQEARKLESLGVLAGGIAHDFNNLLAVILSNVRYAKSATATPEDRVEALGDAEDATESAARLVRQLLAYAGRRKPEVRSVDVTELATSMADLLSTAMSSGVELRLELDPGPLPVHADVVQLEQVLMNLVLNAADAVGEGPGSVTLRTCRRELSAAEISGWLGGDLGPGSYACVEVQDTGVGMDEATRARIFEPFFTTKSEGHGLGLSAVLGLVQGHRGAIEVSSAPGRGTCFRVALPADPTSPARARPRTSRPVVLWVDPGRAHGRGEAPLPGESEALVLEAGDDAQALDLWARHGEEIDAVVIDARASASAVRSLAPALRAQRPELPILALWPAGDGSGEPARPGAGDAPTASLREPFTSEEVRARLEALLAKRDAPV